MTRLIRNALIVGCLAALVPLGLTAAVVADEVSRDRAAAAAHRRGLQLQDAGRLDEAASSFRQAIALSPRAYDSYAELALTEFLLHRFDRAVATYEALMARYPFRYYAPLHREVGFVHLRAGQLPDAIASLREAVAIDPLDWYAYYLIGLAYRRSGEVEAAREAWERTMSLRPGFQRAYEQLRELDAQTR